MQVTAEEIHLLARLVSDLCGVVLDESKGYLIESRLSRVADELGCKSFTELYHKIRYSTDLEHQTKIIDAITTNETLFFRDASPFEALQHKAIPELIDARANTAFPRRLRIWSAASSTGQEPYTVAMVLHELIPDVHAWDISIFATDISDTVIRAASLGKYAAYEVQRGMTPELLQKYFINEGTTWRVRDEIRAMVHFQRLNLLKPFPQVGMFDVILCRNVAIYFTPEARRDLFMRLANCLAPDGYMFVGSAESLADLGPRFAPHPHCRSSFYRPNLQPALV